MGFYSLNTTVRDNSQSTPSARQSEQSFPTTNELANDVLAATGAIESNYLSAVDTDLIQRRQLILAINNAIQRVWNGNGWDWRIEWAGLGLEDGLLFYDVPSDYGFFNTPPVPVGNASPHLTHITYEDLLRMKPGLHQYPENAMDADLTAGHVADIKQRMADDGYTGVSKYWFLRGRQVGFFPIPENAAYVAAGHGGLSTELGGDNNSGFYMMSYFSNPQKIDTIDGGVVIRIPRSLYQVLCGFATAYFKHMIEQQDYRDYENRSEGLLSRAVAGSRRVYPEDAYSDIRARSTP